jgi:hypothetical protein
MDSDNEQEIHEILRTEMQAQLIDEYSEEFINIVLSMLRVSPNDRITLEKAKKYFEMQPLVQILKTSKYVGSDISVKIGSGRLYEHGLRYQGEWHFGVPFGQGIMYYANGDRFEGVFKNGVLSKGALYYVNGDRYEGEFLRGHQHGTGAYYYADGNFYCGDWFQGVRVGKGERRWANGDVYTGDVIGGRMHGEGTLIWTNGSRYVGSFFNDQRVGWGSYFYLNGVVYSGYWDNDQRHGHGTLHLSGGDQYKGYFDKNTRHGTGTFSFASGHTIQVVFKEDKIQDKAKATIKSVEIEISTWECCPTWEHEVFNFNTQNDRKKLLEFAQCKLENSVIFYRSNATSLFSFLGLQ